MIRKITLILFSSIIINSCSATDSNSYRGVIQGKVFESENRPLENISIGIVYRFIEMNIEKENHSIFIYPNPFNNATTIRFLIEETTQYVLKAINLDTSEESVIIDQSLNEGVYSFNWNPAELGLPVGFYRLKDNFDNESIIAFYTISIPIQDGTDILTSGGGVIGQFFTTTDSNGNFEFRKDKILSNTNTFTRIDETGLEIDAYRLRGEVYVIAYLNENNYKLKLIDYTKEQDFNLDFQL